MGAIEHTDAATTYQAQGSTVNCTFVGVDPLMDEQELYVASSRSREETWLCATPEIQAQREELAPSKARECLAHIAEAAERDGAQFAAHDDGSCSRLEPPSTSELVARYDELRAASRDDQSTRAERDVIDHLLVHQERAAVTAVATEPA